MYLFLTIVFCVFSVYVYKFRDVLYSVGKYRLRQTDSSSSVL